MFRQPTTMTGAMAAIAKRVDRPTAMRYREIMAAWDDDARDRAFFSARVTSASILSELHQRAAAVAAGEMSDRQAVELLRRHFVGDGADALAAMGFAPARDVTAGGVEELASISRLELIVRTQVRMAQEIGQYKQWEIDKDIYQYGIWRIGYAKEHRPEHVARDGKAYAFDHPIWTQSPPGSEFNCHCYRVLVRAEDLERQGITPEPLNSDFERSSLGFDPSRQQAPHQPEFSRRVLPVYRAAAERQIDERRMSRRHFLDKTRAAAQRVGDTVRQTMRWLLAFGKQRGDAGGANAAIGGAVGAAARAAAAGAVGAAGATGGRL